MWFLLIVCVLGTAAEGLTPVELGEVPIFRRPSPLGEIAYTPGRGLRLGSTRLTLGGYTNLTASRPEGGPTELDLDTLSMFVVWDPTPRFHLMSELQYRDVLEVTGGDVQRPRGDLTVERLYADFTYSDLVNVRAGIFLTPVGRWNLIHIAPLVWTSEQPLVTELPFDPSLTGAMLYGSVFPAGGVLSYSLYGQFGEPIEGDPEFEPADHSAGARLEYTAEAGWSAGASYLASRRAGDVRHLGGVDVLWSRPRIELMGEFVVEDGAGGDGQWGVYLQSVFALTNRLYLVGRYEHFAYPAPDPSVNLITFGIAFRPLPAVVLKAEYLIADRRGPDSPPGFYSSIATLF